MQIVIDIPKDYYDVIKEIPIEQSTADMLLIRNGTPLPKGHGRLIDADALAEKMKEVSIKQKYEKLFSDNILSVGDIFNAVISELTGKALTGYTNAPTVLKADKEVE